MDLLVSRNRYERCIVNQRSSEQRPLFDVTLPCVCRYGKYQSQHRQQLKLCRHRKNIRMMEAMHTCQIL